MYLSSVFSNFETASIALSSAFPMMMDKSMDEICIELKFDEK